MSGEDKKPQQILELNPSTDLEFKGPFSDVVTSHLHLRNPTNDIVIFKVKTTAPRQYCVRPNSGVLNPQEDATISVMLQPFDPNSADKNKHKFMVQTMFAPPDFQPDQLDIVWKSAPKSKLMDSKLRCVFVEGEPREPAPDQQESTQAVPDTQERTPAEEEEEAYKSVIVSPPQPVETPKTSPSVEQPTAGSTPAHPGARRNDVEKETAESKLRNLQDRVDKLSSENTQLKSETNKLRQRLTSSGAAVTSSLISRPGKATPPQQSSSPLSLIAIVLILVAIILGYLVGKWL